MATAMRRELSVVWDDNSSVRQSIPLSELTEEEYNKWFTYFGFRPFGRMDDFMTLE